jgi:hypothetical protein
MKSQENVDLCNLFKNDSLSGVYPTSTDCRPEALFASFGKSETAGEARNFPLSSGSCTKSTLRHTQRFPSRSFWRKKSISALETPAYSPDLAPRDLFLLFTMDNHSKGQHFETTGGIQKVKMAVLNSS